MFRILKHFLPELRTYWKWALLSVFMITIAVVADILTPFVLRDFAMLVSNNFSENPENLNLLKDIFGKLIIIYLTVWIAWRGMDFSLIKLEANAMRDMENRAFAKIQDQPFRFFQESFTGSLVKKVHRFTNAFESIVDRVIFNFLPNFLRITAIFFIFSYKEPFLGILFLAWAIIFIVGNIYVSRIKMRHDALTAAADSHVSAVLADSISNHFAVKSFAREDEEQDRFEDASYDRFLKRRKSWVLETTIYAVQSFITMIFELSIFFLMIEWWRQGKFTAADLIFIQSYLLILFRNLHEFGKQMRQLFQALADATEMVDIFEAEEEISDVPGAKKLHLQKGAISFENISFRYNQNDAGDMLFRDFTLKIAAGERVALVGPSGGGKSSIVKLLLRLFDPQKGSITIDGQNIAHVTQKSLRENIAVVPQQPEMFHQPLTENIRFGFPNATEEEVIHAAKLAHAHDFILTFPQKYETLVGERGVKLSGGEKQRIALARAFLKNAPIIVLDEATSALDSITEKEIQNAIHDLMKNRTSIVIAHRLSTILQMDRIIVIENGKIVEDGSHQELLQRQGLYARLWEHQAGGFIGKA